MSLSQERPTNPAKRFMNIRNGSVMYYDKATQKNIEVPTPFEFIVLDQLATIKGWSNTDESGFWSNEVRRVGEDTLTVRTSKGIKESGIWKEIKSSPNLAGARYHTSIYLAHKSGDGMEIANLIVKGAALNAWIEFSKKNRLSNVKVVLSKWEDAKNGSVTYKLPVFEALPMSEAEKSEAVELDKELQSYFNQYFNNKVANDSAPSKDIIVDDIDDIDTPISLEDIPF